ncbi:transposase [Streptomyces sp. RKAG293]|nr:transposase [Streptomyces sp. RKAG293]MCM2422818.1 transposase [Streptomyces sp. RKAG293]
MIDAIRYLVAGGIAWRAMPADFPAWDRVYAFFRRWRMGGLIGEFHDRLCGKVSAREGRDAEPTAAVVDSQSVKGAASVPAASRGFDGAKKINGRKRHVIVDTLGLLLMVLVTPADCTDRDAARGMLDRLRARYQKITGVGRRRLHRPSGRLGWGETPGHPGDRQTQRRPGRVRGAAQTVGGGEDPELLGVLGAVMTRRLLSTAESV